MTSKTNASKTAQTVETTMTTKAEPMNTERLINAVKIMQDADAAANALRKVYEDHIDPLAANLPDDAMSAIYAHYNVSGDLDADIAKLSVDEYTAGVVAELRDPSSVGAWAKVTEYAELESTLAKVNALRGALGLAELSLKTGKTRSAGSTTRTTRNMVLVSGTYMLGRVAGFEDVQINATDKTVELIAAGERVCEFAQGEITLSKLINDHLVSDDSNTRYSVPKLFRDAGYAYESIIVDPQA